MLTGREGFTYNHIKKHIPEGRARHREDKVMAENKIMELSDEEMLNVAGGRKSGLKSPKFKEGDHVKVKGYEQFDAVVAEVKRNNDGDNSWLCVVHILHTLGTLIQNEADDNLAPAK